MPYKNETMLMGGDASADTSTELCFNPPEGPFGPDNVVMGNIAHANDEDWIAIKLTEGNEYTITVGGSQTAGELNDSVLKLMDGKGGLISMNDDVKPAEGMLGSKLVFTPEAGSGTQVYFISVSGYTGNPGANNTGDYTVSVAEMAVLPAGESADIEGTPMADKLTGTDDSESIAGLAGDDTIYGLGGDDSLSGGAGADLLMGGAGADTLKGGTSTYDHDGDALNEDGSTNTDATPEIPHLDTISYMGSPMGVTINLHDGTARGGHAEGDTLGEDIENVMGSMYDDTITGTDDVNVGNSLWGLGGNDTLSGREGEDKLYGGAGDDSLDGGDENDTLEGGPGADTLIGGLGADTASYASSMMGVTVRLHASQAMGGDAEGDTWGDTVTVPYTMLAEDPEDPPVEMEETVPDIINLTGSGMADILAGDSRDNTIMGMGGDDKLYGGPGGGDDDLQGGDGDDMLFGGRGADTLSGGMGDDMLNGGAGADKFFGGGGNDMIYADLMDTVIDGGEDEGGMDMDTVSFAKLVDKAVGAAGDTSGVTNAFLLGGADVVYNPDAPAGGSSYGTFAADGTTFTADTTGIDAVGIERVIGTDEDDYITGSNDVAEELEGGDGSDTLIGGTGDGDTVSYASSDRRVRVDLGDGNDDPTASTATASGGHAGTDTLAGFENIKGSAYGDVLTALDGTPGETGSTLWGLGGDDTLLGGLGNDTIEGGAGADEMDGGIQAGRTDDTVANTQANTLSYAGSDAGVTVNLASASASGGHADGDDIETYEYTYTDSNGNEVEIDVATFVNVTGSAHGDNLTGDRFANHLAGGAGDDSLRGGAGADTLAGGPGADRLDGGQDPGDTQMEDWAAYRGAMEGVMVNLNTGSGTGGDAMGDTLKNIELIWGSKQDDTFIASEGVDIIHGDGGSDTVSYEASKHGVTVVLPIADDTGDTAQWTAEVAGSPVVPAMFDAAEEAEVMNWRGTSDSPTLNTVALRAPDGTAPGAAGTYLVQADDGNATTKSYAEGDILASIENVTGSRNDDTITGDAVPNVLKGGDGADTLDGGGENDKLYGEGGKDTLNGGEGNDMLMGGAGNDKLYGGEGRDTLVGGAGDDDLGTGSRASDGTITAESTPATDTFVFAPGNGSDVITNFDVTTVTAPTDDSSTSTTGDKIDLQAFGIDPDDLADLISVRAGNTVINLEDYGGGRITLQGAVDSDGDSTISADSVLDDANGNGTIEAGETDGIFIL